MKNLYIYWYEWKHFFRSPFKLIALVLFVVASMYGLHSGANLYNEQVAEIERIQEKIEKDRQEYTDYHEEGKRGPESAPWVDLSAPFWSVWFSYIYHFKQPSPAMVYSMGQAEQYGFYKRITFWASPYDADMTKEIANPERLQTGTLDFTFSLLYLLPLLLLVLLYNLKSAEAEQGFLSLIQVQVASKNTWLLSRVAFYVSLVAVVLLALTLYGAVLTKAFATTSQVLSYSFLYLLFWSMIYYFILKSGKRIIGNTLIMAGAWLVFAFILPAVVHQWVSYKKPANLMMDFIDAQRDERDEFFQQSDSILQTHLNALFPEIVESPAAKDSTKINFARSYSTSALANELMKESVLPIEKDLEAKNDLIRSLFWASPISFFQNRFNHISQTHYDDYQSYRKEIQDLIDKQIKTMVIDTWDDLKVDKDRFMAYRELLEPY
ncbi:MAG: hypothetical protein AAF806_12925 [Bacteroidota bacterium]